MKYRKNYEICLFVAGCILINYIGRIVTDAYSLPVWLDSVGTVLCAYVLGPVCGAIVGATVNIMFSLHTQIVLYYALVNIMVGIVVGICARKGFLKNLFGVLSTAFLVTIFSVLISVPLNMVFAGGSTQNVWGDGVSELMQRLGFHKVISDIIGEFYLDFLDKVVTMLLLFAVIRIFRRRQYTKIRAKTHAKKVLSVLIAVQLLSSCLPTGITKAANTSKGEEDFQQYVQTIFNGENGLPGGASNAIAQTKDGILWIGTYGGLYRYSGNSFEWINQYDSVKNVNCLYTDEAGRLWIGTNDNGLSIFINGEISNVVNQENGLPSNSVRCITENSEGYYYVGTTDSLVIVTLTGGLQVFDTIPEIVYADSISADENGNVAIVTNEGGLYLVRGNEIVAKSTANKNGESYNCCTFDSDGNLYVGTTENSVEIYRVLDTKMELTSTIACGELVGIKSLTVSENGLIFICADNGVGYLNSKRVYRAIDTGSFNSSIDHMMMDYQGNLWFTSSRLGLLRLSPSVVSEVYKEVGLPENVVNTITKWQGCLYFGTDSGLDIVTGNGVVKKQDALAEQLGDVRIRCLLVDSKNHLWICTSGKGIWEVDEAGDIQIYDSTSGTLGDKFRSAIETQDGTIVVAGDSGISYIKDGRVQHTVGSSDGLSNPRVLSLYEKPDGLLYAGTDGNGIAVLKDGEILNTHKREDGLSSEVILRIVPDSDGTGLFIVSGNGLCYMDEEETIRTLDNFPFYNNFDVVEGNNGELFVLSSAGIYIVNKADLLLGKEMNYELIDARKGLRLSLTPNSWNYKDEDGNLYMAGDRGALRINLNQYDLSERAYRMLLQKIEVDGEELPFEKGETIHIPSGAAKIEITPEIVNYSINDPDIRIYMDGFDDEPRVMPQSEITSIIYTNLPSGKYSFRIAVLDSKTGKAVAENTYQIVKDKEIYDNWWFRLYVGVVAALGVSYLTWMLFVTQMQKTLRLQKMELEWTKKQIQMGNETILTIAKTVDAKDENTSQHSVRVSEYSVLLAKELGYDEDACEELRKTAMLHDIGKIGIPDKVLNKPDKLTDEEYETMKSHVVRGAEILKNFTLIDNVQEGALYHHERYDGRGYVHGLKGEEIPLNARIIGIADAFDAMTANRVYRKRLDLEHVLNELRKGRGTQFDPKLVDIMLRLVEDGTIDVKKIYAESSMKKE